VKLKEIKVAIHFVVNEDNIEGVNRFAESLAGFNHQLKRDFNDDIKSFEGKIDVVDYIGPEPC